MGKLYGRCLRKAAAPALVAESGGTQCGAVPGGGTDLPSVAIQLFLDGAAQRGRTVAVLFTDIKGAFYQRLPEIALGPLTPAPERLELFRKLGIHPAAAQALSDEIEQGATALQRHLVPECWRSALADWHRGSWFSVRGSGRCIMPDLGVRPGDPPADVVFAIAFDAFLKLLNKELDARGLLPSVVTSGPGIVRSSEHPPCPVIVHEQTYMDDTALPMEADIAEDIFAKLECGADALMKVASAFGLTINFSEGKTEAVIGLHGRGLAAARRKLIDLEVATDDGPIPVLPVPGTAGLRIVSACKHLGRFAAGSGRVGQDVSHRCGSASAATGALTWRVFGAKGIPAADRAHVARACVASRLLQGAGTWPALSTAQLRRIQYQYMRPLRRIAGHDVPPPPGDSWPTAIATLGGHWSSPSGRSYRGGSHAPCCPCHPPGHGSSSRIGADVDGRRLEEGAHPRPPALACCAPGAAPRDAGPRSPAGCLGVSLGEIPWGMERTPEEVRQLCRGEARRVPRHGGRLQWRGGCRGARAFGGRRTARGGCCSGGK